MQTATTPKPAKSLWLTFLPAWVLANVIGWGLMYLIGLQHPNSLVAMSGAALLISTLQWLCLRSFLHADYLWIPVSTITYGGFLWAAYLLPSYFLLLSVVMLFLLSGLQGFALSYLVDHPIIWVIVNPFAIVFAFIVIFAVNAALRFSLLSAAVSLTIFGAVFGAVYGLLTGALLVLLKSATKARAAADDSIPRWKRAEK